MIASRPTPAEAFVLLDPRHCPALEAVKITLLSLVAQGILKISEIEKPGFFRTKKLSVVKIVADPPDPPGHVESLIGVVQQAGKLGRGAEMRDLAKVARQAYGPGLKSFKANYLIPALIRRGLMRAENDRVLWLFNRTIHVHTPAGLVEKGRVEATLARARQLPALLKSDPTSAAAVALAAGGLLLLVPELKPYYGQLALLRQPAGADASGDFFAGDGGNSGGDFSLPSFDFGSFDASSFSALDMDFSSFDSSFDSSFSDGGGGGDSGGGDGGGGGGD